MDINEEKNCTYKERKALEKAVGTQVGSSLYILVPSKYARAHNLKKGDAMTIYFDNVLYVESRAMFKLEDFKPKSQI